MGLFQSIVLWYSIFYLILTECVRNKPNKSGNGYGGGNGTGNDKTGADIIITMGKNSNGLDFDSGVNDNNNIFGSGGNIEEEGHYSGTKFVSRGSLLRNRNHGFGKCKVVDFEPIGRDPWEKDEYFWYHGGIVGSTLVEGCEFLFT